VALCASGIIRRNLALAFSDASSEGGLARWSTNVFRRNRTQMNSLIGALLVAVAISAHGAARAQPNTQKDVERVIGDFLVSFSNRDFAVFVPYFSEDATVFFPPSTAAPLGRVQGRSEIERTFKKIFEAYPPRPGRPPDTGRSAGPAGSGARWTRGRHLPVGQRNGAPAPHLRPEAHRRRMEDRAPSWVGFGQPAMNALNA